MWGFSLQCIYLNNYVFSCLLQLCPVIDVVVDLVDAVQGVLGLFFLRKPRGLMPTIKLSPFIFVAAKALDVPMKHHVIDERPFPRSFPLADIDEMDG